MPYRSSAFVAPRVLVVRNHSTGAAVLTSGTGVLFSLAGLVLLLPMAELVVPPAGSEVVASAMGTVFVLVGVTIATLAVRMRRSRTTLALDRRELTVTVRTGSGPLRRHVLPVDDIEHVEVDDDAGGTYRAQIVLRGRDAVALGEARSLSRRHYERMASSVRAFLGS